MKDISKSQYIAMMRQDGWTPEFMGYWQLEGSGISVCAANAGDNRRARLAYMRREKARILAGHPNNPAIKS